MHNLILSGVCFTKMSYYWCEQIERKTPGAPKLKSDQPTSSCNKFGGSPMLHSLVLLHSMALQCAQLQWHFNVCNYNGTTSFTMAPLKLYALTCRDILTKALKLYTQWNLNVTGKKKKDDKCSTKCTLNPTMTNSSALMFY